MQHPISLPFLILISIILIGCESGLPPGIDKKQVTRLPRNPDYNLHIRPILWKLKQSNDAPTQAFCKAFKTNSLSTTRLRDLIRTSLSFTEEFTAAEITLLWRWIQSGGNQAEHTWIHTPLSRPKPFQASFSRDTSMATTADINRLSRFWVARFFSASEAQLHLDWVSSHFESNTPYARFLEEILSHEPRLREDTRPLTSSFLAPSDHNAGSRLSLLLGLTTTDPQALMKDFDLCVYTPIYDVKTRLRQASLREKMRSFTKKYSSYLTNEDLLRKWLPKHESFISIRQPSHHIRYTQSRTEHSWSSSTKLHAGSRSLILEETPPVTAIAFFARGKSQFSLKSKTSTLSLQLHNSLFTITSATNQGKVLEQFQYPIQNPPNHWQHLSLAEDLSHPNGISIRINGVPIVPKRACFFQFPNSETSIYVQSLESAQALAEVKEVKVYSLNLLSPLEIRALYDLRYPQKALQENHTDLITAHLNFYGNMKFRSYLQQGERLFSQYNHSLKTSNFAYLLPHDVKFHLTKGTYFKAQIPLIVRTGELQELTQWLTGRAQSWIVRMTVDLVFQAITGMPGINLDFPEDRMPPNWELIDQWSREFLKKNWNLHHLIGCIRQVYPEKTPLPSAN